MTIQQRITRLLLEVRETREALRYAHHFDGGILKRCACGRLTLNPPCQVCREEKPTHTITPNAIGDTIAP